MLLGLQLSSLISPAYACGCGAMVPGDGMYVAVDREISAVRWDGRTEQIMMRLAVTGDASEAAWIMPVPNRATVGLGDNALFDALEGRIAPERRARTHFWPDGDDWPLNRFAEESDGSGAPAPGGSVGVVGRERLGPFDVARLTATDPDALGDWLEDNGFRLPDALATEVEPYVDAGWEYVAIRLAPRESGETLNGSLDPLRLRFASEELVYPMRLSRLARNPQTLGLYVLAEHRMEPRSAIGGAEPELLYAGALDAGAGAESGAPAGAGSGALAGAGSALRDFVGGRDRVFLTAYLQSFPEPGRISGDHELRRAAADTPYRRVTYYDGGVTTVAGVPVWLLTVGVPVPAAVLLLALRVRAGRRRAAPAATDRRAGWPGATTSPRPPANPELGVRGEPWCEVGVDALYH
ncbi:DUF2330 domain-containing protein, partial [Streptomyces sp. GC420]